MTLRFKEHELAGADRCGCGGEPRLESRTGCHGTWHHAVCQACGFEAFGSFQEADAWCHWQTAVAGRPDPAHPPCRCGGEPQPLVILDSRRTTKTEHRIACRECAARTKPCETEELAWADWDRAMGVRDAAAG